MTEVLGPLPPDMLKLWRDRDSFVNSDGDLLDEVIEKGVSEPLNELIALQKPVGMPSVEVPIFEDFVRSMLRYKSEERASTAYLLRHPWINRNFHE